MKHFLFFEGRLDVGVDSDGRFVGAAILEDLPAGAPLAVAGVCQSPRFIELNPSVRVLLDTKDRVVGVHVLSEFRVSRMPTL